jgi:hypothetical protein
VSILVACNKLVILLASRAIFSTRVDFAWHSSSEQLPISNKIVESH